MGEAIVTETHWPRWATPFLESLAVLGCVSYAARAAGVVRTTPYRLRADDEAFEAAWNSATQEASDALIREARRRAHDGVEEVVYFKGQPCGRWIDASGKAVDEGTPGATFVPYTIRRYSDNLIEFLIAGMRPEFKASATTVNNLQMAEPRVLQIVEEVVNEPCRIAKDD